jgi:4-alpha-glucanotransferase
MNAQADSDAALDELAERCGVELEFLDVHGERQHASAGTQRKILAAMGVAAADEVQVRASLDALEDAEWSRVVPVVCVVHRNKGPAAIEIVLPADTPSIEWRIDLETGEALRGSAHVDALTLLARCTHGHTQLDRRRLMIEADVPDGYHTLSLAGHDASTALIVSPGVCWLPPQIAEQGRSWGLAVQLYALRSRENWGIGDFGDLAQLSALLAVAGGDVVGLNPLHSGFPDDPKHASPYSPASRLLLNVLNIDVSTVREFATSAEAQRLVQTKEFQTLLARCREATLIRYEDVASLKLPVLHLLFDEFNRHAEADRRQAFAQFRKSQTANFQRACLFIALREHFAASGAAADWRQWPEEYRDPDSTAVSRFAATHENEIAEIAWLQWLADEQLREAAGPTQTMAVGLYRDLAVGSDPAGAETWSDPAVFATGARIGAPPDIYNPAGQDWGLPPQNPHALKTSCYRTFIEILRANMRHSGGLRIDHAMGLLRLYWVPDGNSPREGAYVGYPFEDLLGILALESQRQACLIVGEDLGTVPAGFRERMARAQVLSYRVLFFEQEPETGAFVPPAAYPRLALAVCGSHDLPTLRGWWEGNDLALKDRLDLFPDRVEAGRARERRERDRSQLLNALRDLGLLKPGVFVDWRTLIRPVHEFLARSSTVLAMAQLDDLTGECDPANVPGTLAEYPNWSRRVCLSLEDLRGHPVFNSVAQIFRDSRRTP